MRVAFNGLPQEIRERITKACDGDGPPKTIAWSPYSGSVFASAALWLGIRTTSTLSRGTLKLWIGGALTLVWAWLAIGFQPTTSFERVFAYAFHFCVLLTGLWMMISGLHQRLFRRMLPFTAGTYVFPTDVIVAHGPQLEVFSLQTLTASRALVINDSRRDGDFLGAEIQMTFEGHATISVHISDREGVDNFQHALSVAEAELRVALTETGAPTPEDDIFAGARDALAKTSTSRAVDGFEYLARPIPIWVRLYPLTAGLMAMVLAVLSILVSSL